MCFVNDQMARYIFYVLIYIIAYFYSSFYDIKTNSTIFKQFKLLFLMLLCCIIRLIAKKYFDDTLLYNNCIVLITHLIIAISMFKFIMSIKFKQIPQKIVNYLDGISYYVYIVHYIFCVGPVIIIQNFSSKWIIQAFITLCLTFFIANLLKFASEKIIKKIK